MNQETEIIVSVVIPVFNSAEYLKECIESVLKQTLENIEILCINDGSDDNSLEILKRYAVEDDRIIIIDQENKGVSEARNTGARMAKGRYLYFLDSDDYLDEYAFEYLVREMDDRNLQLVIFNVDAVGNKEYDEFLKKESAKPLYHRILNEEIVYNGVELFCELRKNKSYVSVVWLSMIRKSYYDKLEFRFHPDTINEDMAYSFASMLNASMCGCVNRVLYHHRFRKNSIMSSKVSFRNVYGYFCAMEDLRQIADRLVLNAEALRLVMDYILQVQINAINAWRSISSSEKANRWEMPQDRQILFQQMVVYPAKLLG